MVDYSIVEGVKSLVPARSTFSGENSNFGVDIKPTILEKQKYENEEQDVEANPNTPTGSITIVSTESIMTGSKLENPKSGSIVVVTPETIMSGSENVLPKSGSIVVVVPETIMSGSTVVLPFSGALFSLFLADPGFGNSSFNIFWIISSPLISFKSSK